MNKFLDIAILFMAALIWFVRLESKVVYLEKKVDVLYQDHAELKTKVYDQLTRIKESLAKIEGFLQAKIDQ